MEEIIKQITTYGLAVVISGVVLYFAIRFGHVVLDHYTHAKAQKKHDELTDVRKNIGSTVNQILERLAIRTHSGRAYVFEFHNGTLSLGGLPFVRMTNTYEALNDGGKSQMHMRDNMSMLLYSQFADAIYHSEHVVIDTRDRESGADSPLGYETLIERGTVVTVRVPIMGIKKKIIGFVGIDFCKEPVDKRIKDSIRMVQDTALELGPLLSVDKNGK